MSQVNLHTRYKKLLFLYSIIFFPVVSLLLALWSELPHILSSTYFTLNYLLYLIILLLSWYVSLLFITGIRNTDSIKLYEPKILGYYFLVNLVTPFLFSLLAFYLLHLLLGKSATLNTIIQQALPVSVVAVCANLLYDVLILSKEKKLTEDKAAHLEIEKIKAEINILKAQINPHFIFNSMNTLAYLTVNDPAKASKFIELFSKIYRFVLEHINTDWILLREELILMEDFISLQKIKYKESIHLTIHIRDYFTTRYSIPPLSLQILAENAIKHNQFSPEDPLCIEISTEANMIIFKNKLKAIPNAVTSTKLGLTNLKERYRLLTDKQIIIQKTGTEFIVQLPVLKKSFL